MYLIRIGILSLTLVFSRVIGLCRFGSGSDCAFHCNCAGEAVCDPDTGDCGTAGCAPGHPDGYDWKGAGCQTGNVAYDKSANQTGVHNSLVAGKALDGLLFDETNANCAQPAAEEGTPAEWIVDLGAVYLVHNVTIYNTEDGAGSARLKRFEISFDETPDGPGVCGYHDGVVAAGAPVTITCPQSTVGRYVRFQRTDGDEINLVTLCEVVVWGHLYIKRQNHGEENLTLSVVSGELVVEWEQQTDVQVDDMSKYYGYVIEYRRDGTADWRVFEYIPHQAGTIWRSLSIPGLETNHNYQVRISIYTEEPVGRHVSVWRYPVQTVVLPCTDATPPEIVSVVSQPAGSGSRGSITVFYQLPQSAECRELTSLTLDHRLADSGQQWSSVQLALSSGSSEVTLAAGRYEIRLTAGYRDGSKSMSAVEIVTVEQLMTSSSTAPTPTPTMAPSAATSEEGRVPLVPTPTGTTPGTSLTTTPAPSEGVTGPSSGGDGARTVTIAVAVVVTLVVLVALSLTIFFVIRNQGRLRRKKTSNRDKFKSIQRISDGVTVGQENLTFTADDMFVMTSSADVDSTEAVYESTDIARTDPILLSELQAYVQAVRDSLLTQYKKLPQEDHSKCGMAERDGNKLKNRFVNMHAYEHSRVELPEVGDDPDSVYINANYIKDYNGDQEYIATQGPKPNTYFDFWRMVWSEQCDRIVMVTNLVENTKVKCDQYWPSTVGETRTHATYAVTMETEEHYADYKIRIFTLKHEGESRTVRHFHFTWWEDKKRPLYGAAPLLAFRHKIRSTDNESSGPLVVHCSAGVGRTGTLIALDILLQQAAAEEKVEIFNCVRDMRKERMNMVQTKDQYVFLHDALLEAITSGNTTYPRDQFPETYQSLCEANSTELERQFTVLRSLRAETMTVIKDGWKEVNRHKNRDPDIVPEDTDRPRLTTRDTKGNSYINAVYTDSFRAHDAYLVTQMPLPSTQSDFWRLVYDHKVATIVMLDPPQPEDESCSPYWPEAGTPQKYGPILVELISESTLPATNNIVQRDFQVSLHSDKQGEAEPIFVRQLQWLGWALDSDVPGDKSELYSLYAAQRQASDREIPSSDAPAPPGGFQTPRGRTLVHCLNGAARSGLYCVWAFVLDKLRADGEVDVFLGVRYVASRRPQLMESPEQYRLLYDLTADVLSRSDYENL